MSGTSFTEFTLSKYRAVELLGKGGFGTVYRAIDTTLDREVALKVLHPQLVADPTFVERFRTEAKIIAALRHPNVVGVYELGEDGGHWFIAMELLSGLDLRRRIERDGALPLPLTISVIEQIASALGYAHQRNIIHRDVKAANIIVDDAGHATLTDFGLVRALESSAYGSSLSMSGAFVGSVEYIPPELVNGDKATPLSDQYSLGVVAYEMVTGQLPFKAETPIAIAVAHSTKAPPSPRGPRRDLPVGMSVAILTALAKQPTERYPDTKTFSANLRTELEQPAKQAARGRTQEEERARREVEEHERQKAEAAVLAARLRHEAGEKAKREAEEQAQRAIVITPAATRTEGALGKPQAKTLWGLIIGAMGVIGVVLVIASLASLNVFGATPAPAATIASGPTLSISATRVFPTLPPIPTPELPTNAPQLQPTVQPITAPTSAISSTRVIMPTTTASPHSTGPLDFQVFLVGCRLDPARDSGVILTFRIDATGGNGIYRYVRENFEVTQVFERPATKGMAVIDAFSVTSGDGQMVERKYRFSSSEFSCP